MACYLISPPPPLSLVASIVSSHSAHLSYSNPTHTTPCLHFSCLSPSHTTYCFAIASCCCPSPFQSLAAPYGLGSLFPSPRIHCFAIASILLPIPFSIVRPPHNTLSTLKAVQAFLGFQKYKLGADSALFSQEYVDPTADPNAASPMGTDYTSYAADIDPAASTEPAFDGSAGYQGQEY